MITRSMVKSNLEIYTNRESLRRLHNKMNDYQSQTIDYSTLRKRDAKSLTK